MSTNLPRQGSAYLSGEVNELKKTILKRGVIDVPLDIAWAAGYQGVYDLYLDDVTNNQQVGLLKIEAGVDPTLAGTVLYDLPICELNPDGSIYLAGSIKNSYLEGSGYTRQVAQFTYYDSVATGSSSIRIYYRVYSEAILTQDWPYKSS